MGWRRAGLVVSPTPDHRWWRSCAGIPTCLPLGDDLWRVWFGGRDADGRAGVLCADLAPRDGMRVLAIREAPGLERSEDADAFDSAGLWVSAALAVDGRVLVWYTGMRLGTVVPHELAIGLAVSTDGGLSFRKTGAPVLASPGGLPSFVTTPCVRRAGEGFAMWYSHGLGWREVAGRREPFYDLRAARSPDGATWTSDEAPVLALADTPWAGLTRPWIDDDGATLTFSARGSDGFRGPSAAAYRILQAPLADGRVDPARIEALAFEPPAQAGDWDDWMQVAPCIVRDGSRRVMFYNGNHFSRAGFGVAFEEPEAA